MWEGHEVARWIICIGIIAIGNFGSFWLASVVFDQ